jgi:hypothetical protein
MRAWLRRNRIALVAIGVFAPALVWVLYGLPVVNQLDNDAEIIEVAAGETVEIQGYEWTLSAHVQIVGEGLTANQIPVSDALVAAIIEVRAVDGTPGDEYCTATLSSRADGVERSWRAESLPSDYGYGLQSTSASYCSPAGDDFDYEAVFLTPEGAYATSTVDLVMGTEPTVYRFALQR